MQQTPDTVIETARAALREAGIEVGVVPKFFRCPHKRKPVSCDTCAVLAIGRQHFGW